LARLIGCGGWIAHSVDGRAFRCVHVNQG
jgi:hypothetical protein